jgi:hypothetical protein
MQWAYLSTDDGETSKKHYKDEEQTHNSYTPQFAGPLRIPPESFQIRVRKETSTRDTVNSRSIENWNSSVPVQQTDYIQKIEENESKKSKENCLNTVYMDMAPLSSRTDKRDFRQSQPYVPTGPNLAENPFFDRYDPTRDPRNMLREVRSAVYELKESDRGIQESEKIRERIFAERHTPEGETPIKLTEWFDLLRPKIDNPEVVYRNQSQIWKLGSNKE